MKYSTRVVSASALVCHSPVQGRPNSPSTDAMAPLIWLDSQTNSASRVSEPRGARLSRCVIRPSTWSGHSPRGSKMCTASNSCFEAMGPPVRASMCLQFQKIFGNWSVSLTCSHD